MPKKDLTTTFNSFKGIAADLKNLEGTEASNPEEVLFKLEKFRSLLAEVEKQIAESKKKNPRSKNIQKVNSELHNILTDTFASLREEMAKNARNIIGAKKLKEERTKEYIKRNAAESLKAQKEIEVLMPKLKEAANTYMKDADPISKNKLFRDYKDIQKQVIALIPVLSNESRKKHNQALNDLYAQVNAHQYQLNKISNEKAVKDAISKVVVNTYREVKKLPIFEQLMHLLPAQVQSAIKHKVQDQNKLNLTLISEGQVTDLVATNDLSSGSLVLSNMPDDRQLVLFATLINQVMTVNDDKDGIAVVKKIETDLQKLVSGQATHLSFVTYDGDAIHTTHLDIAALLKNPIDMISQLAFAMYQSGVKNNMAINLCSPIEVSSLRQLDGRSLKSISHRSVAELTQQVLTIAGDNRALSQMMGYPVSLDVPEDSSVKLTSGEVVQVLQAVVTIVKARETLMQYVPAKNTRLHQFIQSTGADPVITHIPKVVPHTVRAEEEQVHDAKPAVSTPIVVSEAIVNADELIKEKASSQQPAAHIDVSKYKKQFSLSFKKLQDKTNQLSAKANKESVDQYDARYGKVAIAAHNLTVELSRLSNDFFGINESSPILKSLTEIKEFRIQCKNAVDKAEPEFKNHRGVWFKLHPLIKGILGVFAALTLVPALLVAGTKRGYTNTFFSLPDTNSARSLGEFKINSDLISNDMEDEAQIKMSKHV